MQNQVFSVLDLFCGSGAVTEGLKAEGFTVFAALDWDQISCQTYRLNHPEVRLLESDIRLISPTLLRKGMGFAGHLDLLVVCAPCQPFSSQNRQRSTSDTRANLILESIKFVKVFKPRVIFFENVKGIETTSVMNTLRDMLTGVGYSGGTPKVIDAAKCGVPQRRERCIMVVAKDQRVVKEFYDAIRFRPKVTVHNAIGFLKPLSSGEHDPGDSLHFARHHQQIVLDRLRYIPKNGGSRFALPENLELRCHKGRKNDFPDVYGRMRWEDVAPTLTTGCTDITKGRFAHPRDDRAITLREAALLQSFPMNYLFAGNPGQIAQQIGNAVPVNMVRTLGVPLLKCVRFAHRLEGERL